MTPNITTEVRKTKTLTLDDTAIRDLVFRAHQIAIPANARVTVHVPGGGDWSSTALDIDKDTPLRIEWEEFSTEP